MRLPAISALTLCVLSPPAHATPTTFGQVVGQAVLCMDAIDAPFFRSYLIKAFHQPYKTQGGAEWFSANTTLFGMNVTDIFVSIPGSRYVFVGALLASNAQKAARKITAATGVNYLSDGGQERSPAGGYLISYGSSRSKVFCVTRSTRWF
ncbi:MAG: hypothetical protein M0037_06590 [Betaproteobacteria bacterium]|nr:hypothetical protein [Betaproteobacteria bacterium]